MTFEKKLKALRKKNRMSQEEMAERLNVSRQAISKWELGSIPDRNNLCKISSFFESMQQFCFSSFFLIFI